jgi:hypothetical protein
VEVVALLPLLVVVVATVAQLLAAGLARELAGNAAEAGAIALLQGGNPRIAAGEALPGWSRERVEISVSGRRVRVRLRPPSPVARIGRLLAAVEVADAGAAEAMR